MPPAGSKGACIMSLPAPPAHTEGLERQSSAYSSQVDNLDCFYLDTEARPGGSGDPVIVGLSAGPAHGFYLCWKPQQEEAPPLQSGAHIK